MKISIALLISLVSLQLFAQQQTWHRKQYNARGYTRIDAKFHGQKGTYYNRFGQAKQVFIPWHPSMGTRNVVRQAAKVVYGRTGLYTGPQFNHRYSGKRAIVNYGRDAYVPTYRGQKSQQKIYGKYGSRFMRY